MSIINQLERLGVSINTTDTGIDIDTEEDTDPVDDGAMGTLEFINGLFNLVGTPVYRVKRGSERVPELPPYLQMMWNLITRKGSEW